MARHIEFGSLHNFRDVGGYAIAGGGRVRWGRLYRADALGRLAGADLDRFAALGVRTVIDLRHGHEIDRHGRVPEHPGLAYHHLCVEHRPWRREEYEPAFGLARFFADRYAELAEDGVRELSRAIELIADADRAPVVAHCAAGKDRTGVLVALVLRLLDVAAADVVADYALTGLATERFIADWRADDPHRPLGWPGFGQAPAEAMRLFLDELNQRHGSIQDYAAKFLGVGDDLLYAMRSHLIQASDQDFSRFA
jgi:protein-tyrosine phosphatase